MTITIEGLRNYSATVIKVPKLEKAENSDNLYLLKAHGITSIVDSSWIEREGELALLFPAEVQLDPGYMSANNLYRVKELNSDVTQAGYIETNRRVRAMKLRGNISNGLVLPLSSLQYKEADLTGGLQEGDVFDTINGYALCRKYEVPQKPRANRSDAKVRKAFKRVDTTYLPEHFDTGHWLREEGYVKPYEEVIITQKLHGSSVRLANTIVKRQLTWREKVAQKLGVKVSDREYDYVAGSRKVIKDPLNPNQNHFYEKDLWTEALEKWGGSIPENFVVFGELVGYVPGTSKQIQPGHTYEAAIGEMNLYVYRVAIVTNEGVMVDHTWDQVRDFCERYGLKHTPELDRMPKAAFDVADYTEKNFRLEAEREPTLYTDLPVRLSAGGTGADEGIAVRVDRGRTPEIYKYKNDSHYLFETAQLDTGEPDTESQG